MSFLSFVRRDTRRRGRGPNGPAAVRALAAIGLSAVMIGTTMPAGQAAEKDTLILGAMGDVAALERAVGHPLAVHKYGQLSGSVPSNAKMINMEPGSTPWRQVASAKPGSSLHSNIVRWADTLKSRKERILFAFDHEPEASGSDRMGSASDYIAAYRRVVDIFRSRGVNNLEYTWQMTANAFRVESGDDRAAAKWYPGNSYVDHVGADPYNWYKCGQGQGNWVHLQTLVDPVIAFARARNKQVVLAEWASDADSRRADWLRRAGDYFQSNSDVLRAVFYFQNSHRAGCEWQLRSNADVSAFRSFASDRSTFRVE